MKEQLCVLGRECSVHTTAVQRSAGRRRGDVHQAGRVRDRTRHIT